MSEYKYEKETLSGPIVSFNDGADDVSFDKLTFNVSPTQDFHGYDGPWPGGAGKNLFDASGSLVITSGTGAKKIGDDDLISAVSTGSDSRGWSYSASDFKFSLTAGTYVITLFVIKASTNASSNINIYSSEETAISGFPNSQMTVVGTYYQNLTLSANTDIGLMSKIHDGQIKIMISSGSEQPTSFERYANICPINEYTELNAVHCGKNLSSISEYNNNPWTFWGTNFTLMRDLLNTLPTGTYTISWTLEIKTAPDTGNVAYGPPYIRAVVNGNYVNLTPYSISHASNVSDGDTFTVFANFTINSSTKGNIQYCYAYGDKEESHSASSGRGSYNIVNVQVESGSTATQYSEYSAETNKWEFPPFGKNLFDKDAVENDKYLDTTTGLPVTAINYVVSNYIAVKKDISIYIPNTWTARRWFYDVNKTPKTYSCNKYSKVSTSIPVWFSIFSMTATSYMIPTVPTM